MVKRERSYYEGWDFRPLSIVASAENTILSVASSYRSGLLMFLGGTDFLPESPLSDSSLAMVDVLTPEMLKQPRWANFQVPEDGDMNLATHTLSQAAITAQALYFDSRKFQFTDNEKDILIAGGLLHDFGELENGDVTYDLKIGRIDLEMSEAQAGLSVIERFAWLLKRDDLKKLREVYLRIGTALKEEEIMALLGHSSSFGGEISWERLKSLFQLYERYGYFITAIRQGPIGIAGKPIDLSEEDLALLKTWDRPELEQFMAEGGKPSTALKQSILLRSVLIRQWPTF